MSELEMEWEAWCLADRQVQRASRDRHFDLLGGVQFSMHLLTVFWLRWGCQSCFTSLVAVPGLFSTQRRGLLARALGIRLRSGLVPQMCQKDELVSPFGVTSASPHWYGWNQASITNPTGFLVMRWVMSQNRDSPCLRGSLITSYVPSPGQK